MVADEDDDDDDHDDEDNDDGDGHDPQQLERTYPIMSNQNKPKKENPIRLHRDSGLGVDRVDCPGAAFNPVELPRHNKVMSTISRF